MGIRFRKSIKVGNARINLSKSGIGWSVGTKGLRYTKTANGRNRTTVSIPGTGVSYVSESSSKRKRNEPGKYANNQPSERRNMQSSSGYGAEKRSNILKWCGIIISAVLFLGSIPSFSSLLFLLELFLILPVKKVQDFISKHLNPKVKLVIVSILAILGILLFPR